jgi:hypothetical protein
MKMARHITRKALAIYLAALALYEGSLSASYALLRLQIPVPFDPRLPVNWVFARQLEHISSQLTMVLLASLVWHVIAAAGVARTSLMIPVFAIGETILAVPSAVVFGAALLGFGRYGLGGEFVAIGVAVFTVCSLIPLAAAFFLLRRGMVDDVLLQME